MNRSACPYSVLGVARNCTVREVNSAWRKLSLKWHPDRLKDGDPELQRQHTLQFQCITDAKNELLAKLPPDESRPAATRTTLPRKPRPPAWQPVNRTAPKSYGPPPRPGNSTSSTSRPTANDLRPNMRPKEPPRPPGGSSSAWQGEKFVFPPRSRIPTQDPRVDTGLRLGPEAGRGGASASKPAYELLSPNGKDGSDKWPGEDFDGRFRMGPKTGNGAVPPGAQNHGRKNGPSGPPEFPRAGDASHRQYGERGPHYSHYGIDMSDSDSDFFSDEEDTPTHVDENTPHRVTGLAANVMDLLDDDLAMPAPSRRRPNARTTMPPPTGVHGKRLPQKEEPPFPSHVPGEHVLHRPLTRAFHFFLNASMGLGKRTHAQNVKKWRAQQAQRPVPRQPEPAKPPAPQPAPNAQQPIPQAQAQPAKASSNAENAEDGPVSDKSSSAVSDDISDTSSLNSPSLWNADPDDWAPTEADHCAPTQHLPASDIFSENEPPRATEKTADATVVDVEEFESPEVVVVSPNFDVAPGGATSSTDAATAQRTRTPDVDLSDANSTSSGTSPSPRKAHQRAPSPRSPPDVPPKPSSPRNIPRKRALPTGEGFRGQMERSPPKSVASSSASGKRQRTELEEMGEHSLPVRVRLGYLMQRFSLTEEDAEIVRRAIVSLRAKGKADGLRVSKIFNGHDPRKVDILKSLPIFHVYLTLSEKSCKQVHKVCLRHPENDATATKSNPDPPSIQRVRSMVNISSGSSGDEIRGDDDLGTLLRKSCQHVLPWTYKADGNEIWDSQ